MEQLKGMLQQAGIEAKTEQAKQGARIQEAQIDAQVTAAKTQSDNETKLAIATMDAQTKISIAELQVGQKETAQTLEVILGLLTRSVEIEHERRMDDEEGAHQVGLKAMEVQAAQAAAEASMGHEAGMAAGQGAQDADEAERERAFAAEQSDADRAMSQADGSGE